MDRSELVRRLILNAICDDFENFDQVISPYVTKTGEQFGLKIERADIAAELRRLVNEGLAKVYDLIDGIEDPFSGELSEMPDIIDENSRVYFYITPKGMEFHCSNDEWWDSKMTPV